MNRIERAALTIQAVNSAALAAQDARVRQIAAQLSRDSPNGFTGSVRVRAYRETKAQEMASGYPTHEPRCSMYHCIFPDGHRKEMCKVHANKQVRGYWAQHANWVYFAVPFDARPPPLDAFVPEAGLLGFVLQNQQRFWRTTTPTWVQRTHQWDQIHEYVRFTGLNSDKSLVVLTIVRESPDGNSFDRVEVPVNKFLMEYNPNHMTGTYVQRMPTPGAPSRSPTMYYPFAVSMLVVLKAVFKFRKLHRQAQEKKFAPGGEGHKRLLDGPSAKAMGKKPRPDDFEEMRQAEYEKIIPIRDSVRDLIKSYATTLKTFVYPEDSLEEVMRIAYQDLCPTEITGIRIITVEKKLTPAAEDEVVAARCDARAGLQELGGPSGPVEEGMEEGPDLVECMACAGIGQYSEVRHPDAKDMRNCHECGATGMVTKQQLERQASDHMDDLD